MTAEHHPLCDDDGWDHPGPCVVETELPADPDDPNWTEADSNKVWARNAIDDWYEAPRTASALLDAGVLLLKPAPQPAGEWE